MMTNDSIIMAASVASGFAEKDISCGVLDLRPLIAYASTISPDQAFLKYGAVGKEYGRRAKVIAQEIPEVPGFYLWGQFKSPISWSSIYVGKSSLRKISSLRYRIEDELIEERPFAWTHGFNEDPIIKAYENVWGTEGKARKHLDRCLRKKGAEFIAWASCPTNHPTNILAIEAGLIGHFKPKANRQYSSEKCVDDSVVQVFASIFNKVIQSHSG